MLVIITRWEPYTKKEIVKLREQFDSYIKTVIDIDKKSALRDVIGIMNRKKFYSNKVQNNRIFGVEV